MADPATDTPVEVVAAPPKRRRNRSRANYSIVKKVPLTGGQWAHIRMLMGRRPFAKWARVQLLGRYAQEDLATAEADLAKVAALGRYGSLLNQIAAAANAKGGPSQDAILLALLRLEQAAKEYLR